jgi:CHAT domain-containing protein/tetratricopeptide (TPR) repeat protein
LEAITMTRVKKGAWAFGCVVGLEVLLASGLGIQYLQADGPKAEQMPEQRKQLEERARALQQQGVERYSQGNYAEATRLTQQVLLLLQQLYPKAQYPQGHPHLASSLNNLGFLLQAQGKYAKAEPLFRDALAMNQQLYPRAHYPQGHPHLASSLNNLADLLRDQGDYARAEPLYRQALAMFQQLYPKAQYLQGHPFLTVSLNNLAGLLQAQGEYAQAETLYRDALAMCQQLYPKANYPQGHPDLALSLNNLAALLEAQGEYAKAEPLLSDALAMRQQLYPKAHYPQGHHLLAASLNNLGFLLKAQGEYAKAEPFCRDALAMYQQLYPKAQYPQGHPLLPESLNNLAALLEAQGEFGKAEPLFRDALAMCQQLYPKAQYPQGHPYLALSLSSLGFLLEAQGEYAKAGPLYRDALAMCQQLYPKSQYPQGHRHLAASLNNLATLLGAQGEYAKAEPLFRDALAICQQLYPKAQYPHGHRNLASSLNNLAALLQSQGEIAKAKPLFSEALTMYNDLASRLAQAAPEAQALNYAASMPFTRDGFLSVTRRSSGDAAASYAVVWQSKAALTCVYERRHLAVLAATSPQVNERWQHLLTLRRQRGRLLLASTPVTSATREQQLAELNRSIDQSERELLPLLPALPRAEQLARSLPAELQKALPPHTVFLDCLRYVFFEYDPKIPGKKGERLTPSYLTYVITQNRIERVDLGPAKPIEEAVRAWREMLTAWEASLPKPTRRSLEQRAASQAERLRRLIWDRLVPYLPAGTDTIYLAPDASLTLLPWAALPGQRQGTVLLDDYALAVLPHGPFLLDRLTAPPRAPQGPDTLLVVGGVRYDDRPTPSPATAGSNLIAQRAAAPVGGRLWQYLEGTQGELQQIVGMAQGRVVCSLGGAAASTERLVLELPKARSAHLATHGFFADKSFRSVLQLDEKLFARRQLFGGQIGERIGEGARNPLVLSGLVLAGANQKDLPDRGILTADAIVGLNLSGLELAVLSACETGLGDVAGGEGVFGLQRAFHLAGTNNVIASLWKVDDQATAALMTLFYHHLWVEKLPPIEALRRAQLALYHHPEHIPAWSKGERAPDLKPRPATTPVAPDTAGTPRASGAPVKLWAAFVLSGMGR